MSYFLGYYCKGRLHWRKHMGGEKDKGKCVEKNATKEVVGEWAI